MKAKDMIRQIIREELETVLQEQAKNWWHKPPGAEVDAHLQPSDVHEVKEKTRRAPIGMKKRKGGGGAEFTSAGWIPTEHGRKMTPAQIANRKAIGKKLLNKFRRGGEVGKKYRAELKNQLNLPHKSHLPNDRQHQYSQIWANASAMALNGKTAADVTSDTNSKKPKDKKDKKGKKKK